VVQPLELDNDLRRIMVKLEKDGIPSTSDLTVADARRLSREMDRKLAGPSINIASVRNFCITTTEAKIPVRAYSNATHEHLPVLLFFHGGGWVIGDLESRDWFCRYLAKAVECVVYSVDYRLAPENKFPTPAEDCYQVTKWIVENCDAEGIGPNCVAVSGESAGANLATVVCLMARDRGGPTIFYQLLLYPVTNHAFNTQSYRDCASGYFLTTEDMKWYWNHYLREQDDGNDPYASPLAAKDLSGLPPALVVTAGFDPLRDEGEAYAERLKEADGATRISRYDSMIHGFLDFPELQQTKAAIDEIAAELRTAFRAR